MNDWQKRDLRYSWHPYTQMKDCVEQPPILIERADGIKLYDAEGKFYYDTISSWWCNVHGHNHPKIVSAIRGQLDRLDHVLYAGFTHRAVIEFTEKLMAVTPAGLSRVSYSDDGSTAVETALKMSLQYWQNIGAGGKTKFVSLDTAFHGDTAGAMSVGGDSIFTKNFRAMCFETFKAKTPYCYRCPMGKERDGCEVACIKSLEDILRENNKEIAAVILEPLLMGAAGMVIYPAEYLKKAAELTKQYGVHLIVDEVATGFGRTGRMFACEHAEVEPDFMCLSKGITSGMLAFAATLTTTKVYDAFYDDYDKYKTFYHGHTYTANPICCAAGLASLEVFEEEKTLDRMQGLMEVFHEGLDEFRSLKYAGDVRYIGMVGAIELVSDKRSKEPLDRRLRMGNKIYQEGLKRNLILRPLGDVVYLFLPLCVEEGEVREIVSSTYEIIESL